MPAIEENYDVVVVGAGHAGCEAALACARLGLETIIFTVSVDSIAMMPCNPNIGGSSKGHLVREIDALGGQMGINIDKTFIQSKMLNKSKGPAVHSLRAQADKVNYSMEMRKTLQNTEHLTIRQAEVAEIITVPANSADGETAAVEKKDGQMVEINGELQKITGVKTVSGGFYHCKAVVLCTGTYLRARCLTGEMITYTIDKYDNKHIVDVVALPKLVRFAQDDDFDSSDVTDYLKSEFAPYNLNDYSELVLGCTHFNYFKDSFSKLFPDDLEMVDGNTGVSNNLKNTVVKKGIFKEEDKGKKGTVEYYYSDRKMESEAEMKHIKKLHERLERMRQI